MHALLDVQHVVCPCEEQVGLETVTAGHLNREAPDVSDLDLASPGEVTSFTPHARRGRHASHRVDPPDRFRRLLDGRFFRNRLSRRLPSRSPDPGHVGPESNRQVLTTTRRSSVISRTA